MKNHRGFTLIELMMTLCITAVLAGLVAAPIAHTRDILAVRGARAEIAALAAAARATAIAAGGASLLVDVRAGSAWIEARGDTTSGGVHAIADRYGVELESAREHLTIRYDALGIGRMSNAVLRVRSGSITGTVTVSAYGRVRQS